MSFDRSHANLESVKARCWSIALAVIWASCVLFIAWRGFWGYLGVPHMPPLFADLIAVLSASDCHILGYDVLRQNPCDPWGRPHIYGGGWLLLGQIGLSRTDALWAGVVVNVVFVLLVTALIRPRNAIEFLASLLLVCSPAVLFAMERANVDLLIFAFVCFSAVLIARKDEWSSAFGILIAYAAALLKMYPVAAMIAIPLLADRRQRLLMTGLMVIGLLLAWIIFDLEELRILSNVYIASGHPQFSGHPQLVYPRGPYAFGGTLLFTYLGSEHAFALSCVLAGVLSISALSLTLWVGSIHGLCTTHEDQTFRVLYCLSFVIVLFCFLAATNYDYRFIFFLAMTPWLLGIVRSEGDGSKLKLWVLISFALMILFAWSAAFIRDDWGPGSPTQQHLRLAKAVLSWILILFFTVIFMRTIVTPRGYVVRYIQTQTRILTRRLSFLKSAYWGSITSLPP